jgi:hypothetical protein
MPTISMVSQKLYIPPYTSLLELITYKKGEDAKKYEKQVIELLQEIEINSATDENKAIELIPRLHEKENGKIS